MKKLIFTVCTIALAIVAHGASCDWSTDYVAYAGGDEVSAGTYWVLALGSSSETSGITISDGGVIIGLAKNQSVAMQGNISAADSVFGTLNPVTSADNGKYYALLLWDGFDSKDGGMFGISDAIAMSGVSDGPVMPGAPMDFRNGEDQFGGVTFLNQNVTGAGPVPEPTSGLLLLLGVAGMALRRRRI